MKKLFIVFLLALLCGSTVMAQLGGQAGITSASVKTEFGDEDDVSDAKLGFTLGLVYRLALGNLALQPELNFTQKGGESEETIAGETFTYKETYNYIEFPIYLMYMAASKKEAAANSGFFAGIGPAFNFAIGGKWKEEGGGQSEEGDINFGSGDNDDYKPFEMSGNLMLGYMLTNGLYFSAIYSMGLTDFFNDDSDEYSIKNRYIGFRIGFMFGAMKGKGTTPN